MSAIGLGPVFRADDCGFLGVIAGTDIPARCQLLAHHPGTTHRTWFLDRMEETPMADEPGIGEPIGGWPASAVARNIQAETLE